MAAYVIFIKEETHDQHELDIYTEKMGPLIAGLPATVLSAYGRMEVLEGTAPQGVVLVSFPSFQEASQWYHSAEYQSIVDHRHKGATYRGFIIDSAN